MSGDPHGKPFEERRVVPRIDHGDFETSLDFDPSAKFAAFAFVGPRPNVSRGDVTG